MTRSRWSEVEKLPRSEIRYNKPFSNLRENHSVRENHSEIEKLADEHRQFVFSVRKEARDHCTSLTCRMLLLVLAGSVLLTGLALTTRNVYGGSGIISLLLRLVYGLGAGSAALLLVVSMALAMLGATCIWEAGPGQPLPTEPLARQALFKLVLADVAQLRQAEQRSGRLYRRATRFFLAALVPYSLVVVILILQVF